MKNRNRFFGIALTFLLGSVMFSQDLHNWRNVIGNYNSSASLPSGYSIVVGSLGLISFSTDYGTTWISSASPALVSLTGVAVVDEKHSFACGARGTICETVDGGKTWTLVPGFTLDDFIGITVRPDGLCQVISDFHIYESHNFFVTTKQLDTVPESGYYRVCQTDKYNTTWLATTNGKLFKRHSFKSTWERVIFTSDGDDSCKNCRTSSLSISDSSMIFCYDSSYAISSDNGLNWYEYHPRIGSIKQVISNSKNEIALLSSGVVILKKGRVVKSLDFNLMDHLDKRVTLQNRTTISGFVVQGDSVVLIHGSKNLLLRISLPDYKLTQMSYFYKDTWKGVSWGDRTHGVSPNYKNFYHTTDDGATWLPQVRINKKDTISYYTAERSLMSDSMIVHGCTSKELQLLRSTDGGVTYDTSYITPAGGYYSLLFPLGIDTILGIKNYKNPDIAAIMYSTNQGITWLRKPGLDSLHVFDVSTDGHGTAFMLAQIDPRYVYDSLTNTHVFKYFPARLLVSTDLFSTNTVHLLPRDISQNLEMAVGNNGNMMVLGYSETKKHSYFLGSINAGSTWSIIDSASGNLLNHIGISQDGNHVIYAGDGFLWQSYDGGSTWKKWDDVREYKFDKVQPKSGDQLFVTGSSRIGKSSFYLVTDNGFTTGIEEERQRLSLQTITLERVFPNPSESVCNISISWLDWNLYNKSLSVKIFDIFGNCVADVSSQLGSLQKGNSTLIWQSNETPPGIYFVVASSGKISCARAIVKAGN